MHGRKNIKSPFLSCLPILPVILIVNSVFHVFLFGMPLALDSRINNKIINY
jgi:hypothetical protein